MNAVRLLPRWFGALILDEASGRHGLQLATAVVIAYLVSVLLGLPEGFWAVMSALIVLRPNTGATLGAGWDRVKGTVVGTLFGLGGVWLRHLGLGTTDATLAVVAVLAFGSAVVPGLRSAPIAALIVLSGGGIAGHSAWGVAGLRVAEITIGVVTGLSVSLLSRRALAAARFDRDCAALLRRLALRLKPAPADSPAEDGETAATALRAALRGLAVLAADADRETVLLERRRGGAATAQHHRGRHARIARLMMRIAQDAGLLARLLDSMPQRQHEPLWDEARDAALHALQGLADGLDAAAEGAGSTSKEALGVLAAAGRRLRACICDTSEPAQPAFLLAGPLALLQDDLRLLARATAAARGAPSGG